MDYVVKEGEVVIVDEFTGRQMPGRRWSDGLHQAVEAKEGVKIERENQTLATITFQNYFRMYKKLSGMTGTAETEAPEFHKIYKLEVVAIPTNKSLIRIEYSDVVYRTEAEKFEAAVNGILQEDGTQGRRHPPIFTRRGQPVLVGSISIEKSETIAEHLEARRNSAPGAERQAARARSQNHRAGRAQRRGHRFHEHGRPRNRHSAGRQSRSHGARILPEKQAGHAVRAGRRGDRRGAGNGNARVRPMRTAGGQCSGTQRARTEPMARAPLAMVLFQQEGKIFQVPLDQWKPLYDQFAEQCKAEHDEVVAMGGLHILGTERHEARRIDNQLRGRAGRQGDPGSSRFFLSLEDNLLRIFGGERVKALMYCAGHEGRHPDRVEADQQAHRERAEGRRSAELRGPQTPAGIRRRDEQAARDDLLAAAIVSRGARPEGIRARTGRNARRWIWSRHIARASSIPISGTSRNLPTKS